MWDAEIETRWETIKQLLQTQWSKGLGWRIDVTESSDTEGPWQVMATYEYQDKNGLIRDGHRAKTGATLADVLDELIASLRHQIY